MKFEGPIRIAASVVIWIMIVLSIPTLLFVVPLLGVSLASSYGEFSNEGPAIMLLLGLPVLLSQSLLGIVLVLLGRIRSEKMFTAKVDKWVRFLAWNAFALSLSFVAILFWFGAKNTMPPIVLLGLLVISLLALAVALVTATLLGVLRRATAASNELDSVI